MALIRIDGVDTLLLLNTGNQGAIDGGELGYWLANAYRTIGSGESFTNTVDTQSIIDAAPEAVYQSYSYSNSGVGNRLAYEIPLMDGTYTVRAALR